MENEKIELKDRLLAGAAYWNGWIAAIISLFYFKDRKGFVYRHCVQALFFSIALSILFLAIGLALVVLNRQLYESITKLTVLGLVNGVSWFYLAIFAVLFLAAASGMRFRIPIICNVSDIWLKWMDDIMAKAEEAKKKKAEEAKNIKV